MLSGKLILCPQCKNINPVSLDQNGNVIISLFFNIINKNPCNSDFIRNTNIIMQVETSNNH